MIVNWKYFNSFSTLSQSFLNPFSTFWKVDPSIPPCILLIYDTTQNSDRFVGDRILPGMQKSNNHS
jgi:hypothetical protein